VCHNDGAVGNIFVRPICQVKNKNFEVFKNSGNALLFFGKARTNFKITELLKNSGNMIPQIVKSCIVQKTTELFQNPGIFKSFELFSFARGGI